MKDEIDYALWLDMNINELRKNFCELERDRFKDYIRNCYKTQKQKDL